MELVNNNNLGAFKPNLMKVKKVRKFKIDFCS